jgi:hypothetical protein
MRPRRRASETQKKSVIEGNSKEKTGNAIKELDLLHRPFINHGDYGGHPGHWGIKDDLLVVWRGMEDPPPSEQAGYLPEI